MIRIEVKDDGGRLTKRLVKDVHADLKDGTEGRGPMGLSRLFRDRHRKEEDGKCSFSLFRVAFVLSCYQ